MTARVFDDTPCDLGEGPLWHPTRQQLFWFDILGKRMLTRTEAGQQNWQFDRPVSAAGWVDERTLIIATDCALMRFDIETGAQTHLIDLEADTAVTRSNHGRADPFGGFWIGTMGKQAERGAGALYRYFKGELRQLRANVTIPNATCFAPDGSAAYFADTALRIVWRNALDGAGWPKGAWDTFLDLSAEDLNPDGAVVDAEGRIWIAQWGASRVACYGPGKNLVEEIYLPVPQPSCPAFGGPDLSRLFVTTARQDLGEAELEAAPLSGQTFCIETSTKGQPEHRVIL